MCFDGHLPSLHIISRTLNNREATNHLSRVAQILPLALVFRIPTIWCAATCCATLTSRYGHLESFNKWTFNIEKLPVCSQCNSTNGSRCSVSYLWAMGNLLCLSPLEQCLSAGHRQQGECAQSSKYWGWVDVGAMPRKYANDAKRASLLIL